MRDETVGLLVHTSYYGSWVITESLTYVKPPEPMGYGLAVVINASAFLFVASYVPGNVSTAVILIIGS